MFYIMYGMFSVLVFVALLFIAFENNKNDH